MWRGRNNGARVAVVEGEVHVERVENLELIVKIGIPSPAPPPPPPTSDGNQQLGCNVDQQAADFIRRSKERFRGEGGSNGQI
ncbi:unnamed protein product [Miscanthus lutarioriparius]|uniref:Uncharacterized protein n=1 Tax=Miscanthus lutarioriparius TaxID=422564 RepID=A0A811RXN3_9POAL|nr:unnamed protein product [Miscanthus lutarioriparius]